MSKDPQRLHTGVPTHVPADAATVPSKYAPADLRDPRLPGVQFPILPRACP